MQNVNKPFMNQKKEINLKYIIKMTISEYKCSVPIFCICLHAPLITICNAFFFTFFVKQPGFKMEKKNNNNNNKTSRITIDRE